MTNDKPKKTVFLDRDGTLIEEVNFLSRVDELRFFPYTSDAVKRLKDAGFLVIVVTNQSGIGRGMYDEAAMHSIHDAIQSRLSTRIDAFYFCPHLPNSGCVCRKPGLGMIENARENFAIEMEGSWMIGDKRLDIETGFAAGINTALVQTGYGSGSANELERRPDIIASDLSQAVDLILSGGRD